MTPIRRQLDLEVKVEEQKHTIRTLVGLVNMLNKHAPNQELFLLVDSKLNQLRAHKLIE